MHYCAYCGEQTILLILPAITNLPLRTMADVHDKKTRSFNMSRIKGKDTKPEMVVRRFLFANGFRYCLHDKRFPGKPDIVLPKYKTVIFVHGCFWHGHEGCKYFVVPKTRTEWWLEKINSNRVTLKMIKKSLNKISYLRFINNFGVTLEVRNIRSILLFVPQNNISTSNPNTIKQAA